MSGLQCGQQSLLILFAILGLTGCSPLLLLNTVTSDENFVATLDIPYGILPRQRLDIYTPPQTQKPAKVVIFFYGDRWQSGTKEDYRFVAKALTSKGFLVIIPNYRLYPEVSFPTLMKDSAQAVRWVKDSIESFGGNPNAIYLVGYSSGAHMATLLTLDDTYLGKQPVRGTVALAGSYDFLLFEESDDLQAIFGSGMELIRAQPVHFVDGNEPPMLLLSGEEDTNVQPGNTLRLAARIRAQGGQVQVILYPGVGHTQIIAALAPPLRHWAPTLRDITDFINNY